MILSGPNRGLVRETKEPLIQHTREELLAMDPSLRESHRQLRLDCAGVGYGSFLQAASGRPVTRRVRLAVLDALRRHQDAQELNHEEGG